MNRLTIRELSERAEKLLNILGEADHLWSYLGESLTEVESIASSERFIECFGSDVSDSVKSVIGNFSDVYGKYEEVKDLALSAWGKIDRTVSQYGLARWMKQSVEAGARCSDLWDRLSDEIEVAYEVGTELTDVINHLGGEAWAIIRAVRGEPDEEAGEIIRALQSVIDEVSKLNIKLSDFLASLRIVRIGKSHISKQEESYVELIYNALVSLYMSMRDYVSELTVNFGELSVLTSEFNKTMTDAINASCSFALSSDVLDHYERIMFVADRHGDLIEMRRALTEFHTNVSLIRSAMARLVGKQDRCEDLKSQMLRILREIRDTTDLALANIDKIVEAHSRLDSDMINHYLRMIRDAGNQELYELVSDAVGALTKVIDSTVKYAGVVSDIESTASRMIDLIAGAR